MTGQSEGMRVNAPLLAATTWTFFLGTLVLGSAQQAEAIKPHRCRGRIQFTPCKDLAGPLNSSSSPRAQFQGFARDSRFPIKGPRYAKLISSSYSTLNRSTGLWSGEIRGNGLVETELVILRRGVVESSRYMGHVWLQDKSTPFKITSAIPKGRGWDWSIKVWAR